MLLIQFRFCTFGGFVESFWKYSFWDFSITTTILVYISTKLSKDKDNSEIGKKYKSLINDIEKDVNLKNILSKKEDAEREETLNDLMLEIKEMNQLKQIEFLENKVAKNLDESSYSELIKLKSQLNRQ